MQIKSSFILECSKTNKKTPVRIKTSDVKIRDRLTELALCQINVLSLSFLLFLFLSEQFGENRQVLQALRTMLEEFREELQEEETRRCQLQQSYANDKAAWEVKWAEMKCQVAQVQMASQRRPPYRDGTQSGVA